MKQEKVTVVGLGYIGLPMALLLAKAGHTVSGFDVTASKIDALQNNQLYFEEKGLPELFETVVSQAHFSAHTTISEADVFVIAVPTPQENGAADLSYVVSALEEVKKVFKENNLIILESTIGPRDAIDTIIPTIKSWGVPFLFAYCPERAIPGSTLTEMVKNDRIIGAEDTLSLQRTKDLYATFVTGELLTTNTTVAASCKVMENTYRAVNIALANEFAILAEKLKFNVWEAIKLANHHPRVHIHQPGPGVGGHCIPIDPWFFVSHSPKPSLIELALTINEQMAAHVATQVKSLITEHQLVNPTIGILGYAYKPDVDDARETPTEKIISQLSEYKTLVSDPFVTDTHTTTKLIAQDQLLSQAQVIIIATAHSEYTNLDFSHHKNIIFIYDCHNCIRSTNFDTTAIIYYSLGKAYQQESTV